MTLQHPKNGTPIPHHILAFISVCLFALLICRQAEGQKDAVGILRSQSLKHGVPLGGIGTGNFQILTNGTISQATIHGNWTRPTPDLAGCFGAIWTRTNNRTNTRVLALKSAYQLPTVQQLDYDGLYPQIRIAYRDPSFPLAVSLTAFSPLIPHDIRRSSFPAAALLYKVENRSNAEVECSVALAWENTLGEGTATLPGDRDGNTIELRPDADGLFAIHFSRENRTSRDTFSRVLLKQNSYGNMTLMTKPEVAKAIVTEAGWNALEKQPAWWTGFAEEGVVRGNVGTGVQAKIHPSGVVAVKFTLKPKEEVIVPFAIAWYSPNFHTLGSGDYGHFYHTYFQNSYQAARTLLNDWRGLYSLSAEWQNWLLYSNLPPQMARRLINTTHPLSTHTLLTKNQDLTMLASVGTSTSTATGLPTNLQESLGYRRMLLELFPMLARSQLERDFSILQRYGALPLPRMNIEQRIGLPQPGSAADNSAPLRRQPGLYPNLESKEQVLDLALLLLLTDEYVIATGDVELLRRNTSTIVFSIQRLLELNRISPTERTRILNEEQVRAVILLAMARAIALTSLIQQTTTSDTTVSPESSNAPLIEDLPTQLVPSCKQGYTALYQESLQNYPNSTILKSMPSDLNHEDDFLEPRLPTNQVLTSLLAGKKIPMALKALADGKPKEAQSIAVELETFNLQQNRSLWLLPDNFDTEPMAQSPAGTAVAAQWMLLAALSGVEYDVLRGDFRFTPQIPGDWKSLQVPIFAPTFWGLLEYKPTTRGSVINFRVVRLFSLPSRKRSTISLRSSGLRITRIRVPGPPSGVDSNNAIAFVSLARTPRGVQTKRAANGDYLLTFETPIVMFVGDRLEIDIH